MSNCRDPHLAGIPTRRWLWIVAGMRTEPQGLSGGSTSIISTGVISSLISHGVRDLCENILEISLLPRICPESKTQTDHPSWGSFPTIICWESSQKLWGIQREAWEGPSSAVCWSDLEASRHPGWAVSLGSIQAWQGSGPLPVFRLQRTLLPTDTTSVLSQEPRSYFSCYLFIEMKFGTFFYVAPWFFFLLTISLSFSFWRLLLGSEDALKLHQPGREMKDFPCDRGSSETPRGSRRAPLKQNQASKVQGNSPMTICRRFMYYWRSNHEVK